MNYSGKFDAKLSVDGSGPHFDGHGRVDTFSSHATHAPAGAIIVPDAHLLFNGDFKRSGVDLILSKDDQGLVLHDYFKGEKHAALASPDGAYLTGDIVNALTGYVEYAQADGSASVNKVIGHVTKLAGTATAVRNGVSIILNQGDNVEKGDVLQSGSGSTLGVTFIDGTVFGLSSNARMVLNEMVYDPNGSNNSSLLSLVAGTITFVAGETAKHGDMKIDTPVATMGIRGTAVLVEIDFDVPGQAGLPNAKFQVLVEPDGTTGSYILFDKTTLTPIAIVDRAGQQLNISNGTVTQSTTGLPPEIQKLITDVFSIKYTDTNTKSFDHHTDTPIPDALAPLKFANLIATPIVLLVNTPVNTPSANAPAQSIVIPHISQAPSEVVIGPNGLTTGFPIIERAGVSHSAALDQVTGTVNFVDINAGDAPTVSTKFDSFTYQNAAHADVTAALNAQQLADIAAVEAHLTVIAGATNKNTGSATWTYSVPDGAFDFLAAGETLTLTYNAIVDNNYLPNDQTTTVPFTIIITGTNDAPVITTGPQTVGFIGGKDTKGGDLAPNAPTSGTLVFTDPDLTDTHTIVSTDLTNAALAGAGVPTLDLATLETKFPGPFAVFEKALSASVTTDSTGTGTGAISWKLADLAAYLADIVPNGETLTLTYTVKITDSQGTTDTQDVSVTITGNEASAVVWIETTATASTDAAPGDWNGASNWGTGTVPTANDDVIIVTNQLQPKTPFFPVTIKSAADNGAAAFAKSLSMNDFGTTHPELDNDNSLTIGGGLNLSADAIIKNFGNLSVGTLATLLGVSGLAEIADNSVLQNSGTINLGAGGDFTDQSSITNSGTIELSGGTLNVDVDIANSGAAVIPVNGTLQIDSGATLDLVGAAIMGGTVTNHGTLDLSNTAAVENGDLNNTGRINVSGTGNVLGGLRGGETITNSGAGFIDITGDLTLNLADVTNGGNTNAETVESGASLTLLGAASIDGGTLNNIGTLTLTGAPVFNLNTGVFSAGTFLTSGILNNTGQVNLGGIDSFDKETITNSGTIEILASGALTIDQGSTIANTGGHVTVDPTGTLTLNNATITGGALGNAGMLDATGPSAITNVGITNSGTLEANGGELDITGDSMSNAGKLQAIGGGILKLISNTVINTGIGTVTVGSGSTLDLIGATISGSTIVDESTAPGIVVTADSTIENATINGGGDITVNLGSLTLSTVTLDDVTLSGSFINSSTLTINGIVTLDGATVSGGVVADGSAAPGIVVTADSTIENATINGGGDITVTFGSLTLSTVALDDVTLSGSFINSGTLTINGIVTLAGATVSGGVVADGSAASGIVVTADSIIENATINGGGDITVTFGSLTLSTVTLDDVTLSGSFINADTLTIDHTVTLAGATITNKGIIDDTGTLDVTVASEIDNGTVDGGGALTASGATLTLSGVTLDTVTLSDTAGGSFINADTLTIDHTVTLAGATITNNKGIIDDTGTLDVTVASEIDNGTVDGGGALTASGATLTLSGVTLDTVTLSDTAGGSFINADTLTIDHTVTLAGATITNKGIIGDTGALEVTVASEIDNGTVDGGGALTASGAALTLSGVTLDTVTLSDTAGGSFINADTLTIDHTVTLAGATIIGGTIADSGDIDVTVNSKIEGVSTPTTVNANLKNGNVTVEDGVTLTLDNVTVTGTTITGIDPVTSIIEVDNGTTLTLQGGATLNGGTLSIDGTIETETNAAINVAHIIGGGTINIDDPTLPVPATLVLGNGATVTGVELSVGSVGTLEIGGFSGATLNSLDVEISNGGALKVDYGDTLALSEVTVNGGTIIDLGKIDVTGQSTISNAKLYGGNVTVESGQTLKLDKVAAAGTTFTDNGEIDVTGNSEIKGLTFGFFFPVVINAVLNGGKVTVESGKSLTLDYVQVTGTTFTDNGTIALTDLVTLAGIDAINGIADGSTADITNAGILDITGTTTLNGDNLANAGILKIDGTLILSDTIIGNGTITDHGTIDVVGKSSINDAALHGGMVTVEANATLTLADTIVNGTTFEGSHAAIGISGNNENLTLAGDHDSLTLAGDNATIAVSGTHDTLSVDGFHETVNFGSSNTSLSVTANDATINITGSDDALTLTGSNNTVTLESNNASLSVTAGSDTINVTGNHDTLSLTGNANDVILSGNSDTFNFNSDHASVGVTANADTINFNGNGSTLTMAGVNDTILFNGNHDTVAFNFSAIGQDSIQNFDVADDEINFKSSIFSSVKAILDATHDVNGNAVITINNALHETITLVGVHASQLHNSDFHIV